MATNVSEPVARMYALALLEIGRERGIVGKVHEGLMLLAEAWKDTGFKDFFTSPRLNKDDKAKALTLALQGKVAPEFLNFVLLLVKKRREAIFDNIVGAFEKYRDEAENRVHAYVQAGSPFNEAEKEALKQSLRQASGGKDVVLHYEDQPELLGGARVRLGDLVVDTTLKRRLSVLARKLA
ncbi:MAG: ATP synthase subunit delta [Planctomycetota bacterium]|nr:ATP synthase F1 subunit delta [Planctomycetota bacterium]GIK52020.1 MAG: ATP synthase subunit delta [Planctomycetota bacterium]